MRLTEWIKHARFDSCFISQKYTGIVQAISEEIVFCKILADCLAQRCSPCIWCYLWLFECNLLRFKWKALLWSEEKEAILFKYLVLDLSGTSQSYCLWAAWKYPAKISFYKLTLKYRKVKYMHVWDPLETLRTEAEINFVLESLKPIMQHSLLPFKFLSICEFSFSFKWFLCLHNVISCTHFILYSH